jgi:hypothetical protein
MKSSQLYNEFINEPSHPDFTSLYQQKFHEVSYENSLTNKDLEIALVNASQSIFSTKVNPSLGISRDLGNTYTASLFFCLASLLSCVSPDEMVSLFLESLCFTSKNKKGGKKNFVLCVRVRIVRLYVFFVGPIRS